MTAENGTLYGPPLINLPPETPLADQIIMWMNKYLVAFILCFVLFGNLTAFSVFSMPPYRHSVTAVLYRVLAVVDTMAVGIYDGLSTLPWAYARVKLMSYNNITCKLFSPLCVLPFIFIISFNIAIIYVLLKRRRDITSSRDNHAQTNSAAMILIAVSFSFIMLTMPFAVFLILQKCFLFKEDIVSFQKTFILGAFANVCDAINHSINIVLYCFCGRKFRQCLWEMMRYGYWRNRSNVQKTRATTTYRRTTISTITTTEKVGRESIPALSECAQI